MRRSLFTIALGAALVTFASGCAEGDADDGEADRANRGPESASEAADEEHVQQTTQALTVQRYNYCVSMRGSRYCYTICKQGDHSWLC